MKIPVCVCVCFQDCFGYLGSFCHSTHILGFFFSISVKNKSHRILIRIALNL